MKVVFVNLYPDGTIAKYLLSTYLLKAYLRQYLPSLPVIEILNFHCEDSSQAIAQEILQAQPDMIGYSCYTWNIQNILRIISLVDQQAEVISILGGPEISLSRIHTFAHHLPHHYYVSGEGERAILSFLRYFLDQKDGKAPSIPDGIAYWQNDILQYAEQTERIRNLDEIPSIYLSEALESKLYAGQQAFLETQRGCVFKCKYCVYHKHNPGLTYYSLPRVFAELDFLICQKNIRTLRIFDAIFTSQRSRAKQIMNHLIELKHKMAFFPWIYWEFTYDLCDAEFIELIAQLKNKSHICNTNEIQPFDKPQHYFELIKGYNVINCIGLQSFLPEALKAIARPPLVKDKFDRFMQWVNHFNILLKADLILGLPYETYDTFFQGIEFFLPYLNNTDHILNLHRLQILPGSELEALCETYGITYSFEAPHYVLKTSHLSREELNLASKLVAILLRIINSPLRKYLYQMFEHKQHSLEAFLTQIFRRISATPQFQGMPLLNADLIEDIYWNEQIYADIPTQWLLDFFEQELANVA